MTAGRGSPRPLPPQRMTARTEKSVPQAELTMAKARPGNLKRFYDVNGWLFVAPALLLIATFMFYPIIRSLVLSTFSGRGMMMKFVGFGNVVRLWNDPVFWQALTNTMTFLVIQVPVMIMLALILANALNNPRLKFSGLFRTAIFLPCVSSLVA